MPDHVHVIIVIVGAGLKPAPTVAIPSNQVTFSDRHGNFVRPFSSGSVAIPSNQVTFSDGGLGLSI